MVIKKDIVTFHWHPALKCTLGVRLKMKSLFTESMRQLDLSHRVIEKSTVIHPLRVHSHKKRK